MVNILSKAYCFDCLIFQIIWSQEFELLPKLLANNNELFIKNPRFSLEKSDIFNDSNMLNDRYLPVWAHKYYNLKISPLNEDDTGWYSCYLVKRLWFEPNIKYYTYLKVQEHTEEYDEDVELKSDNRFHLNTQKQEISEHDKAAKKLFNFYGKNDHKTDEGNSVLSFDELKSNLIFDLF